MPDSRGEKRAERFGEGETIVPVVGDRDAAVEPPEARCELGRAKNWLMKLQIPAGALLFAIDNPRDHLGLQIEHRPGSGFGAEWRAVVNLSGRDRNDVASDSLDLAAAAIGALRACRYEANAKLIMAMAREVVVRGCLDSPDPRETRAPGTDSSVPAHDEC